MLTSQAKGKSVKRVEKVKKDKKAQRDKKVTKGAKDPKGIPPLLNCTEAKLFLIDSSIFPLIRLVIPAHPIYLPTRFALAVIPGGWFRGPPFRSPLQGGLKGLGARGGGDEGLKVEGGFTFGRLQGGLKGASSLKGASRGLEGGLKPSALKGASRMLEGGFKGASRGLHLEGGFKGA